MEIKFSEQDVKDLLGKVKIFQPDLGEYHFFTINEQFSYLVKLSNGTIHFTVEELIANKEQRISKEQLIHIANGFLRSGPQRRRESIIPDEYSTSHGISDPKKNNSKVMIFALAGAVIFGLVGAIVFLTANPGSETPPSGSELLNNQTSESEPPKTEEELKEDIYKLEMNNPKKYVDIEYSRRESLLLDEMKFEGKIRNNASLVTFRNFNVTIKAYSATDYLLEERNYVITETASATGSTSFKLRTDGWDHRVNRFEMVLNSAEGF